MDYRIKVGRPPNFFDIIKVFPKATSARTIFAYLDTIYVSHDDIMLPPSLIMHECTHLHRQQAIGVDIWWKQYMADRKFRYIEELLAHQAEYRELVRDVTYTEGRLKQLKFVARRLVAPLYGFNEIVTFKQAMIDIAGGDRVARLAEHTEQ